MYTTEASRIPPYTHTIAAPGSSTTGGACRLGVPALGLFTAAPDHLSPPRFLYLQVCARCHSFEQPAPSLLIYCGGGLPRHSRSRNNLYAMGNLLRPPFLAIDGVTE